MAALALLLLPPSPGPASAETVAGRATVIDGDTIEIRGARIRLHGLDAPETGQQCRDASGAPWPCGRRAAFALDDFLAAARPTTCTRTDTDRWGRMVATCLRADGRDVNDWLVRQGWALDWQRYSGGAYAAAQDDARDAGRGVWTGAFVMPWDWRRGMRLDWTVGATPPDPDCAIKGNINARGERIYHVPGGVFYDRTIIDKAAGQRWFCSPAEAEAAGWRRARLRGARTPPREGPVTAAKSISQIFKRKRQ